jgi:transaldolase
MKVKIFADGADLTSIKKHMNNQIIEGFTTNPTLMAKAGITDYRAFAKEALHIVADKSISFEVFADDDEGMKRQAREIASWGDNVYVKIPAMKTTGQDNYEVMHQLAKDGVKINATAIFTTDQIIAVSDAIGIANKSYVSVFAGRIGDAGGDVDFIMTWAGTFLRGTAQELLWASPRQVYDVVLADKARASIITLTDDLIKKVPAIGKDLTQFSLETCQMFYNDAKASGFSL